MFKNKVIIEMEKPDEVFNLRPVGDIHIGNPAHNQKKFEDTIKYIAKHDNYFTIGMGDYIDNVMAYRNGMVDKRWNEHSQARHQMTTLEQIVQFVQTWKELKDETGKYFTYRGNDKVPCDLKSIGMHSGNHEWHTIDKQRFKTDFCHPIDGRIEEDVNENGKVVGQYFEANYNKDGKVETLYADKYLGRSAFIQIGFNYKGKRKANYTIFSHHGGYSGRKKGGAINRMTDISGDVDCDLLLMGHNHQAQVSRKTRLRLDYKDDKIYNKKILLGNTGTFLDSFKLGYDGYEEISPREATVASTITITFEPETGGLKGHE